MSTKRRWRRVHIDEQEWRYSYVNFTVEIRDPENNKTLVRINEFDSLKHWTVNEVERAKWKGNKLPAVSPGLVKHHIEKNLLGRNVPDYVYPEKLNWHQIQDNRNHWAEKQFETITYAIRVGYKKEDEEFEKDDFEVVTEKNRRPVDIIKDIFENSEKPIGILIFNLNSHENSNPDEQLHAFDRNDNEKEIANFVVMSARYGSGASGEYGQYHTYTPKVKHKIKEKTR